MKGVFSILVLSLLSLSFLALIPVPIPKTYAQTGPNMPPVVSPGVGTFEAGSTITVSVAYGYYSTDTYTVNLFYHGAEKDGCILASPLTPGETVATASGEGAVPPISFAAPNPAVSFELCAEVIDTTMVSGSPGPNNNEPLGLTGGPASYVLVPPLTSYVGNDESYVRVSAGEIVPLVDFVSGGTVPYTYTWSGPYSSLAAVDCESAPIFGPSTSDIFSLNTTGLAAPATYYYGVEVTDSTSPGAPSTACEPVTVQVYEAMEPPYFTINSLTGGINSQVPSPNLMAVLVWDDGVGPWYTATVYSGTDSLCSGDTTVVATLSNINATEAVFTFPEPTTPSSTTYYCAKVTDSSFVPETETSGPIQVNVNPGLKLVQFSVNPRSIDYGQPSMTVTATINYFGGTSPYKVAIYGESSAAACSTTYPVYVDWSATNWSGSLGYFGPVDSSGPVQTHLTLMSGTFSSLPSTTYYCAVVTDSSVPVSTVNGSALFTVEPLLAANPPSLSTYAVEPLSPYYEGNPMTATVTWSGGTGPFDVELLSGFTQKTCTTPVITTPGSNPQTSITGYTAMFSFLAPNTPGTTAYYCATVTDVTGIAVTGPVSAPIVVSAYLLPTALSGTSPPNAPGMTWTGIPGTDLGQTEPARITVSWTGGNAPYTVTLYSGTSTNCAVDTTMMSSQTGLGSTSAVFDFTSPAITTYYCAKVTDDSTPPSSITVGPAEWVSVADPVVTLPAGYEIAAGTSTSILAVVTSTGVPPDHVEWFIGPACTAANAITKMLSAPGGLTYTTGIITTTTTYSILLNDSSKGSPAMTSCASITITATNGPIAVAVASATNPLTGAADPFAGTVYVANPCSFNSPSTCGSISVIDSDTNTVVNIANLTTPGILDSGLIPFGAPINPHGVAADNVNELVYVSGNATYAGTTIGVVCDGSMATFSNPHILNALNTCTQVGNNPEGIAVGNNLGQVYVANNRDNTVSVLSTIALKPITTVQTGPGPLGVAVDQKVDLNTVYVTDNDGNTLTVLQPRASNTFAPSTVNVGFEPVGVVVNPGTDNVYVANSGSGTVTELKALTYNTVATISLPPGSKPTGIDIDTASDTLYVADASAGTVFPISIPSNAVGTSILVGSTPYGIAVFLNPQSTAYPALAYVTNSGSNTVSAIDAATNTVIATIFVP